MGLSCGATILKYVLFLFNLLIAILSLAIVVVASLGLAKLGELKEHEHMAVPKLAVILLLVVGIISFLIAFFGCCGAIRNSTCLLNTYAVFLLLLMVAKIAIGAILLCKQDKLISMANDAMHKSWDARGSHSFDVFQETLKCCGLHSPADWLSVSLPASCCSDSDPDDPKAVCLLPNAYNRGCLKVMDETLKTSAKSAAIVTFAAAGIELIGFVFTCILIVGVRNDERHHV